MIGRVKGKLLERSDHQHHALVTIAVSGLGIEVHVPRGDIDGAMHGSEVELFTDFILREDSMTLYGFSSAAQRSLFRSLQTVTGVGPKLALVIIGATDTDELIHAIIDGDIKYLEGIPGIGKKVASRISLELKEKMSLPTTRAKGTVRSDVVSALVNLGYSERDAAAAASDLTSDLAVEAALKEALSRLHRKLS